MPVKAPIMKAPPMPVYTWTGCYIGGGVGYGFWNQEAFLETTTTGPLTATNTSGGRGWLGRAQVGCDFQISSSFVIGAFADYDWADLNGQFGPTIIVGNEKLSHQWAAGGRIGYLVTPTVLSFFSAGWTQAHFDQVNFASAIIGQPLGGTLSMGEQTYNGWFIGGGWEYQLSFLPQGFTLKTEYRYSQFDAVDIPLVASGGLIGGTGLSVDSKKFTQTITTELVWRFNMWH